MLNGVERIQATANVVGGNVVERYVFKLGARTGHDGDSMYHEAIVDIEEEGLTLIVGEQERIKIAQLTGGLQILMKVAHVQQGGVVDMTCLRIDGATVHGDNSLAELLSGA